MSTKTWKSFGSSVIGATHADYGKPNQDAFFHRHVIDAAGMPQSIAAVSDGHGGARYIRSDKGARFAVENICETVLSNAPILKQVDGKLTDKVVSQITANFYRKWAACVDADIQKNPFTKKELTSLRELFGEDFCKTLLEDGKVAYGSTVLLAATYDDMILTMQLGDGNILFLYEDGTVKNMTADCHFAMADETLSLGDFQNEYMRHNVFTNEDLPVLITLSTDGVVKSFENKEEFMKMPCILHNLLANKGIDKAKIELEEFLSVVTDKGAGDDVTMAVLYRSDRV